MGWGGLHDDVDGGFFRCAATRDWQEPRQEKLLDVNASLLRTLRRGRRRRSRIARYRERAADVARYVQTWLADPVDGGWSGSQQADRDYYARTPDERRAAVTARRSTTCSTPAWNAQMVSATLRAAELLDDTGARRVRAEVARAAGRRLLQPGRGHRALPRRRRPSVRGLLDDQVAMAAAHLDAHAATGNIVYEMMAQELAHYAVRMMWDEQDGGFFDRVGPRAAERVGLMRERLQALCRQLRRRPRAQAAGRSQRRSRFRRAGRRPRSPPWRRWPRIRAPWPRTTLLAAAPGSDWRERRLRALNRRAPNPEPTDLSKLSEQNDYARSVAALKNLATELRIDSIQSTTEAGSGHPTTCMSAAEIVATLFFGEMRFDPRESAESRQRSLRAVEGACRADSLRGVGARRALSARGPPQAAPHRLGSRRASDAAAVVCRRRDRIARPGHLRGRRHGAQRAPHRIRLPDLRAARRRRDGGRLGVGGGRRRALSQARQPLRHRRRQRARPEPAHAVRASHGRDCGALERVRLAHADRGRPRRRGAAPCVCRRARREEQPDDDSGAHDQGQGRRVGRRQGRLARQGVQERRGGRQGHRRAQGAACSRRCLRRAPRFRRRHRKQRAGPLRRTIRRWPRRRTSPASRWRRAKRGERRWPRSAPSTRASSRSTPTSRTRRSAIGSRRRSPIASTRTSSPSR